MALQEIAIYLDRPEYSRFEATRSVVRARIVPTPSTGLVAEQVAVSLLKKGVPVFQTTITLDGDMPKGKVVEIDLKGIKDANGVTHINRGEYTVYADQEMISASADFKVSMITAAAMRQTYCQGLNLTAGSKLAPKKQPSVVTGVQIVNVSEATRAGLKALVYDATANTLTWGDGATIELDISSSNEILLDSRGGYVEVEIDHFNLPDADASEAILIDVESITDEFLQREIEQATQEVELDLKLFLEPTRVATEPYYSNPEQGEYFDAPAEPLAYYEKDFNMRGMSWQLNLPHHQVHSVDGLVGYIGNTKALSIANGAMSVVKKSGILNILPYNSHYSFYYTFMLQISFWGPREFIPGFWRYKAVAGIDESQPGEIMKMVGFKAAISVLTTAGQAHRTGVNSESISKDGVSRSTSYNAKGIYDSAIQEYKDWLKINVPKYRNIYRGIPMVTL